MNALPLTAQTRLIVVEPGHFHASLLQRQMHPGVSDRVAVYARLDSELLDYLNRVSLFNNRVPDPTRWSLDIHTSADPMAAMLRDLPGNAVIFTGKNRGKIDRILAALSAGLNVLADKPWIISPGEMPKLENALDLAERKGLAAYDIMTERYEVSSEIQRELVNTPGVFGTLLAGTASAPAIQARSVHHVMKVVEGVPLRRPAWFFDSGEYGEGLADVGTHVADLVQWTAFPDQPLDYARDIHMLGGRRWPLDLTRSQFQQVTGEAQFPATLAGAVEGGTLHYFCNNAVEYTLRGVHVKLDILWNWEADEGGDIYEAAFRGSKARIEIRQGAAEELVPEVYVVPADPASATEVFAALNTKIAALQSRWPGLAAIRNGREARISIPQAFRATHDSHFAQVASRFFEYVNSPQSLPRWERSHMLAKYYVSTRGVELGLK